MSKTIIHYRNYWATAPNGWHYKGAVTSYHAANAFLVDSDEMSVKPSGFGGWIGEWKHYTKLN